MNKRMAGIPVEEYKRLAGTFNPVKFDAKAIARLAKDAGMKYIVVTANTMTGLPCTIPKPVISTLWTPRLGTRIR